MPNNLTKWVDVFLKVVLLIAVVVVGNHLINLIGRHKQITEENLHLNRQQVQMLRESEILLKENQNLLMENKKLLQKKP